MCKLVLPVCLVMTVSTVACSPGVAKSDNKNTVKEARPIGPTEGSGAASYRAKELIGSAVSLDGGTSVGSIDDIVIGGSGKVDYLIVTNTRKQLVAVPWDASRYDVRQRKIFVRMAPERFRQIPSFPVGRYPMFADPEYRTRVYRSYGLTPAQQRYIEERSGRGNVNAGIDVRDPREVQDRRTNVQVNDGDVQVRER